MIEIGENREGYCKGSFKNVNCKRWYFIVSVNQLLRFCKFFAEIL